MNTVRSFWLGWGAVTVAGVGAYVFAKKQINIDRQTKHREQILRKQQQRAMEMEALGGSEVENATGSEGQQAPRERSKYEAAQPYKPRVGERFS